MDPIYISDWFADQYADRTPPWGFNGLGYVVFKRTYARPIFKEGTDEVIRTEEWHEAVQRVVNGAQDIGAGFTEQELIQLYNMIFNLKMSPGGRMLWQLGTPNTSRLGGDSLVNCLGGETEVVTRDGIKRIDDLAVDGHATLMTDFGKWVTAEVLNFGEQSLAEIKLRRGRQTKTVRATAEHRWIVRGRNGREEFFTKDLTPGMKLVSIKGQGTQNAHMSNDGVRAGLVYGDGTVYDTGSRAFVAYDSLRELEHLFLDYKSLDNGSGSVFYGLPRSYKAAPDLNEFRGYLYGWLAGYFAADGYARDGKRAQINSTKIESLQLAKDVATMIGVATGPIYSQERISNLTGRESTLYTLPLHVEDPEFFLLAKHRGTFEGRSGVSDWVVETVGEYGDPEPVYCAVVPDTHTFALADNLLTGNCWMVDISKPSDFSWSVERLMLGGGVGFSCNHPERLGVVRSAYVEHQNVSDADFIVPDTREGWANLVRKVIEAYVGGDDEPRRVIYNTQHVRPIGVPIRTFGGTASGPAILIEGVTRITQVLDGAIGRQLTSVEVMDIMNIIGSIVVAGNVRRSAEIALGDVDDEAYLMAKRWDLGQLPKERAMSNNSVFVSVEQMQNLPELLWEGYRGKGEPYGFFNLESSRTYGRMGEVRPDPSIVGVNPCVTGDTWVLTEGGPRIVNDLLDAPFTAIVDGKPYSATAFWETGVKDVLRVTTSEGYSLRVTEDHKILTPDGWVEAGLLEPGDSVVIHDHLGASWDGKGTEEEGYVLGHLVGDGTFAEGTPAVAVWDNDDGSDGPMKRLTSIMGGMDHRSDWIGWRQVADTPQWRSKHVGLRELAAGFDITPGNKTVTTAVEMASSAFYVGFLRGLFDTDGHVEGHSTRGGVTVRLSQSDHGMLVATQRMLARLGVKSSIHTMHPAGERDLPGGTYHCQESFRLVISGQHAERFMDVVGFENQRKVDIFDERTAGMNRSFYRKPMVATVSEIVDDGREVVYDCTVSDVHAFDANGVYVHNCAEIPLGNRESCNLAEIFLPNIDSQDELIDATLLLYKLQKAIAALPYIDPESDRITSKNMRLGTGITGIAQALDKIDWLDAAYNELREFDVYWSEKRGWPESVRLTTVKPSGTLSLLAGVTPGVHPAFSQYFVKRMRMGADSPLVDYCRNKGFHVEAVRNFDGTEDHRTIIVEFPCAFPENTVLAKDMTAIQQLDLVRRIQRVWADNAVSVTVYYRHNELDEIREYLKKHWGEMKSVSFLLHSEHGFDQAPMGELTKREYEEMLGRTSPLGERISGSTFITEDEMAATGEACDTGSCPLR